jgi:hypothetical protein
MHRTHNCIYKWTRRHFFVTAHVFSTQKETREQRGARRAIYNTTAADGAGPRASAEAFATPVVPALGAGRGPL